MKTVIAILAPVFTVFMLAVPAYGQVADPFSSSGATVCGVSIERLEYFDNVPLGEENTILVTAVNTGNKREVISLNLFTGSRHIGSFSSSIEAGQRIARDFTYPVTGNHEFRINVETNCGSGQTILAFVSATYNNPAIGEPYLAYVNGKHDGVDERYPEATVDRETEITVRPSSMDVELNSGEVIEVLVRHSPGEREPFTLEISGIPKEWISYDAIKSADSTRFLIFVFPKEIGNYDLDIFLDSDSMHFESSIKVFVATPSGSVKQLSFLGTLDAILQRTAEVVIGNTRFLAALTISFVLFVVSLGVLKLRREDEYIEYPSSASEE